MSSPPSYTNAMPHNNILPALVPSWVTGIPDQLTMLPLNPSATMRRTSPPVRALSGLRQTGAVNAATTTIATTTTHAAVPTSIFVHLAPWSGFVTLLVMFVRPMPRWVQVILVIWALLCSISGR